MGAPGNSILIVALFAVFVACCGYAAGRIHQRRHTGEDREEAYRDGYEKGSHSVFSLAARVIVPRRPVRATVPVKPESDAGDETTLLPSSRNANRVGFPVPPPPPDGTVPEPPAVGGVRYQRFPDPRTGGETTVLPDLRDLAARPALAAGDVPEPRRGAGHRAPEDEEDTITPTPPDDDDPDDVSSGRHTVPEELVKASTYRLPPDRVFRAKVAGATTPLPDEATTKLVPKPRQS
jgi:hypothetical protein